MNAFTEGLVTVALAIVGLGVVATIVSKNANTANVLGAGFKGLGGAITAAEGPVMGGGGLTVPSLGGGFGF
jgi:hypothetical protein